jgi:hypothetical protein
VTEQPARGALRKKEAQVWAREEHDHYVEPHWCSERLFEVEKFEGCIVDPACGFGRIVKAARQAGYYAWGADIVRRAPGVIQHDFLDAAWPGFPRIVDNVVSNAPFGLCDEKKTGTETPAFVEKALEVARNKVAILLPAGWDQGDKRSRWIETTPLRRKLIITPRPSMPPGYVVARGEKPASGTTDYAWFIWLRGYDGKPELGWLRRNP